MMQKWFVSQGDRVYGPWSTDDVFTHRGQGNVSDADLIWGAGQDAWVTIARWNPEAKFTKAPVQAARAAAAVAATPAAAASVAAKPVSAKSSPAATAETAPIMVARAQPVVRDDAPTKLVGTAEDEVTKVTQTDVDITAVTQAPRDDAETVFSPTANEAWHYAFDGASHGPFNRPNLLLELRRLDTLDGVVLWTKGMRAWAGIFEFHDLANELGISQRKFARAALAGRVVLKVDGLTQVAPIASISEGGVGLTLNSEFFAGQAVSVEVQADALGAPFTLGAEVRYCARGVVGLKFESVPSAVRSRIAGYVKHAGAGARAA